MTDLSPDVVTLNVGGTIFQTTRATLTSGSAYFHRLLTEEDNPLFRRQDVYFLDRNPKLFDGLLSFLRSGVEDLACGTKEQRDAEIDFFAVTLPRTDPEFVALPHAKWICVEGEFLTPLYATPQFLVHACATVARNDFCALYFIHSKNPPKPERPFVWGVVGKHKDLSFRRALPAGPFVFDGVLVSDRKQESCSLLQFLQRIYGGDIRLWQPDPTVCFFLRLSTLQWVDLDGLHFVGGPKIEVDKNLSVDFVRNFGADLSPFKTRKLLEEEEEEEEE